MAGCAFQTARIVSVVLNCVVIIVVLVAFIVAWIFLKKDDFESIFNTEVIAFSMILNTVYVIVFTAVWGIGLSCFSHVKWYCITYEVLAALVLCGELCAVCCSLLTRNNIYEAVDTRWTPGEKVAKAENALKCCGFKQAYDDSTKCGFWSDSSKTPTCEHKILAWMKNSIHVILWSLAGVLMIQILLIVFGGILCATKIPSRAVSDFDF